MIAAIRVRFTPTPPTAVWNDAVFANWLNPTIQYSLAHFWFQASFTQADLQFQIFPPVVMDDPRLALSATDRMINAKTRPALVNAAIAKVTDSFHPDWSTIDGLLIWYAQPTDLFGGGTYDVPLPLPDRGIFDALLGGPVQQYKQIPVALCDIAAPFDAICQELGHAYGFDHPLDLAFAEYGDPYDSMASEFYGGKYSSMFERPLNPALPVGVAADGSGDDVERNIGPYVSAAQLYISHFAPALKAAGMFINVPPSYASGASSFTLHALDTAIINFPAQPLAIAAVIPPDTPGGNQYFLELRRVAGYDSGLNINDASAANPPRPPLGVVIHSYDATRNRIVYVDTLPLVDNRGDRDYHCFAGGFTFRVTSIGTDYRTVGITVGGREFWRNFGVNIEDIVKDDLGTTETPWTRADVSPCFMFGPGDYFYHLEYHLFRYTLVASSFGYELPTYVWTVNGTALDPAKNTATVSTSVETPGPAGKSIATTMVPIEYTVGPARLSIGSKPDIGNFSLLIEVESGESSPGVLKNFYPDKSQVTSVRFDNVKLIWDENYTKAQKACADAVERVNEKHIPLRKVGVPKPEDPFRGRPLDFVVRDLADTGLRVANAVIDEVARVGNIVIGQISKRG